MPPTGRVLLDTNIIIQLFADDAGVRLGVAHADAVFVPVIALGELFYGARQSGRVAANLERITAFAAAAAVLVCDGATAAAYGELKAVLRAQGTPIPENDIWIAALARQHALKLATRDIHFEAVPGLDVTPRGRRRARVFGRTHSANRVLQ
jgi:tRNA(fMet)-specific endonuclease VapC